MEKSKLGGGGAVTGTSVVIGLETFDGVAFASVSINACISGAEAGIAISTSCRKCALCTREQGTNRARGVPSRWRDHPAFVED